MPRKHPLTLLPPHAPAAPRRAWVEFADGTTSEDFELTERERGRSWTARPPGGAVVAVGAGDHLRVDRLCAECSVVFENVIART